MGNYESLFAPFFNELYVISLTFSTLMYKVLSTDVKTLMVSGMTLYLSVLAIGAIVLPQKGKDMIAAIWPAILAFIICLILISTPGEEVLVLKGFRALENLSLAFSTTIVNMIADNPFTADYSQAEVTYNGKTFLNGYALLTAVVEMQMMDILSLLGNIARGDGSGLNASAVVRVLMVILGMLPYIFVLGIFAAFMAEAMFKYVAISIVAPILIAVFPVRFFRPFSASALRILIGAFLTLIFAAGAMGFTVVAVDNFKNKIEKVLAASRAADVQSPQYVVWCGTGIAFDLPRNSFGALTKYDQNHPDMIKLRMTEEECSVAEAYAAAGAWIVFEPPFLMMTVIGFLSVLLHLQAKTLASNLSGANDGAGPAAAVVMAAKTATFAGAGIAMSQTSGGLFGRGGARQSIDDVMSGNKNVTAGGWQGAGQALRSHGLIGGSIAAATGGIRRGAPTPDNSGNDMLGSSRFSTGAGGGKMGGGGNPFGNRQAQQDFAKVLTQSLKEAGIGGQNSGGSGAQPSRDRNGGLR